MTRGRFEIVAATGSIPNNTRPFYIVGAYLSTSFRAKAYHKFLSCLSDIILKIKTTTRNPYIVIAGDFNRKNIEEAIGDYPHISVITTGTTHGMATLDEVATSFNSELVGVASHGPLETEDGRKSDHDLVAFDFKLKHTHEFQWVRYSARHITDVARSILQRRKVPRMEGYQVKNDLHDRGKKAQVL